MTSQIYDAGLVNAVAANAKTVAINSRSSGSRFGLALIDIMLSMALLAILWAHLQLQLSNSTSLLLPNFTVPHLLLPVLLLLGHVAMFSLLRTRINGSHLIPSIVESLFVLTFFCLVPTNSKSRFLTPVLTIAPVLLIPNIVEFFERPFYKFFLIGEYMGIAYAILLVELGVLVFALVQIARQPKRCAMANRIDESIGINGVDQHEETVGAMSKTAQNKLLQRLLVHVSNGSPRAITHLWNAGFEHQSVGKWVSSSLLSTLPLVLYIVFVGSEGIRNASAAYGFAAYLPTGLLVICIYASLLKSFHYMNSMLARQPLFEQETVLPISKSRMRRIRMGGLWVEVWPWLIASLGFACLGTMIKLLLPSWQKLTIGMTWSIYFHCLLSLVGVWGLGLLLLTIRLTVDRRWISYLLAIAWVLVSIVLYYEIQYFDFDRLNEHAFLALLSIMLPGLIGFLLFLLAWTSFPNIEWGNESEF